MRNTKGFWFRLFLLILLLSAGPAGSQEPGETSGKIIVTPALMYFHVSDDEEKFREDWWTGEGMSGGLEQLTLEHTYGSDVALSIEARAVVPEEDYNLELEVKKSDLGFFRGGYTEYRKYFDGTGGFFAPFGIDPLELGDGLHVDLGTAFLEIGLTLPDWPNIIAGYEHRYRKGEKSLLEWGGITKGGTTRQIFPSLKDIDEEVEVFRLEMDHTIGKVHFADEFRYEDYQTETRRLEAERDLDAGTSETVSVRESYSDDALYNTFHLESRVTDKLYGSLGYLYTSREGDAGFRMNTTPFGPEPFDKNWFARSIEIEQDSHVVNLNTMVGPYRDFTFYGGMQAETTESEGEADAVLTETAFGGGSASPEAAISSRTERDGLEETVGIRYRGIPFTTAYAEAAWVQYEVELSEQEFEDGLLGFERLTDTDLDRDRYTVGINTSPFRGTTMSIRYRRSCYDKVYDHSLDTEPGYSAFIKEQSFDKDDISARLTLRPSAFLRLQLSYQLLTLDIETRSDTSPPSSVLSGDYDADIYSIGFTLTPAPDFYFTGLVSYQDTTTESFDNGSSSVFTYEGDVLAATATAKYAMDRKTDLGLEYLYSRSTNLNEENLNSLPLGMDNRRHALLFKLSRRLTETMDAQLRYGYYAYDENGNGGVDDYRGHLFGASWTIRF